MKIGIDWISTRKLALQVFAVLAFIISVGFADSRQNRMICKKVDIRILDTLGLGFVEPEDIRLIMLNKFGEAEGKNLKSINIALLEKIVGNNPFVANAEVFSSVDGKLNIEVLQRRPIVRVVNFKHESFYIDDLGIFMPLSEKFTARVPVANGHIFNREGERFVNSFTDSVTFKNDSVTIIQGVYDVASFISRNDFWNAQVEQIYVTENGELELIPRVGQHTILFGDAIDIQEKFDRLFMFYSEGLSKTGWDKYKTINIKFKDQVVCTKK